MLDLIIAAALAQSAAPRPDPCNAAGQPVTPRPGCPAWRYVGRRDIGVHYVDPASLTRNGDTFEVDGRVVLVSTIGGDTSSFTGRSRYNCATRLVTMLVTRLWSPRGVMIREEFHTGQYASATAADLREGYDFDAIMLRDFCPHGAAVQGGN